MSEEQNSDSATPQDDEAASDQPTAEELEAQKKIRTAEAKKRIDEARNAAYELLFVNGLYSSVSTSGPVGQLLETSIRNDSFGFDAYCVTCKRETTFRVASRHVASRGIGSRHLVTPTPPELLEVSAVCQRDYAVYSYIIKIADGVATKVGQIPSMAALAFGEIKTIDRSLDENDRQELGKALGLHAHDTAIGAFVYLRRVFERMIGRAHERQAAAGHAIDNFSALRMDERIAALKDELPDKVVQNSAVFAVLSVGIHELTEEQCTRYFPVLKAVLFQMLEQEEHKRKSAITARETDAALRDILKDLGNGRASEAEPDVTG